MFKRWNSQFIASGRWVLTYPLFGPLGAKNGHTIPTIPHRMVKTAIGTTEAPILRIYLEIILNYFLSNKHQLHKNGGQADYVGSAVTTVIWQTRFVQRTCQFRCGTFHCSTINLYLEYIRNKIYLTSNQLNRIVINIFMDNCVTIRSRHLEFKYIRSKMYYNFSVCVTIKKTIYLTEGISGIYFLIWVLALFTSWRFLTSVKCLMSFKT